jgi:hypothetical protein
MGASWRGALACIVACVVLLGACYGGPGTDHYVGLLDELAIPADWEFVATERRGPGEEFQCEPLWNSTCPGAGRWYALSGDARAALEAVRDMVERSGYMVSEVLYPDCDAPPSGSACNLFAVRGADRFAVSISPRGRNTGLDNAPDADVIIEVTAQR